VPPECKIVQPSQLQAGSGILIIFALLDSPECDKTAIIAASVAAAGVACIAAAIVGVRCYRRKKADSTNRKRIEGIGHTLNSTNEAEMHSL